MLCDTPFIAYYIIETSLHAPIFYKLFKQMNPSKRDTISRISSLLKSRSISIPAFQSDQEPEYRIEVYEPIQMTESSLVGKIVGGVVVSKNQTTKQLLVHLTTYYDHIKKFHISPNRYIAFIKDYELKANLSIFGYLNNFKDIDRGTFINAWVRRTQKRQNKTYFQLHLNRPPDSKNSYVKLGVVRDNVKVPQSVLKVYEKEETLPMNFLILYEVNFDNPGLERIFQKELKVEQSGSLHGVSNLAALKRLDYNLHRLLYYIKQDSAHPHLELGLECMKDARYTYAIQCFNISLKFDRDFVDTHIAKACAHANMNNLSDALKSIKQALKLDPHNHRAQRYYEQFQKQLSSRVVQQGSFKKKIYNSDYKLVFQK